MAVANPTRKFIDVDVSDKYAGVIPFAKQRARFLGFAYEQSPIFGTCNIGVRVLVTMYEIGPDNTYGPELTGINGLSTYEVTLVANNDTIVDGSTGKILAINTLNTSANDWQAAVDNAPDTAKYQGDFFLEMLDSASIVVGQLVRQHITQANAMGRFQ